jgi:hypothetical protein
MGVLERTGLFGDWKLESGWRGEGELKVKDELKGRYMAL